MSALPPREFSEQLPTTVLAELREAHAKLLHAMADLDRLARGDAPTKEQVINARWNLSRASLARRKLWHSIYTRLPTPSDRNARELRRLHEGDMALLRSSSDHIAKWSITEIMQDWSGYCAASDALRWKMKAAIGNEQRVLYPLLERSVPD